MKRVLILGCPGAGKTTLSLVLAARTGLPVIHLDTHYWRAGWAAPTEEEWRAQVAELIRQPAWILDGNYTSTIPDRLAVADTAIILDFPTWRCLWRVFWRSLRRAWPAHVRPDLPDGCSEQIDLDFFRLVAGFRRRRRPQVLAAVAAFSGTKRILRNPTDVRRYLEELPDGGR